MEYLKYSLLIIPPKIKLNLDICTYVVLTLKIWLFDIYIVKIQETDD